MREKGFTLMELMITVAIVSILAAVAVPSYLQYVQKARRSEAMAALQQTINAMEKYKLSKNSYPVDIASLDAVIKSHGLSPNGSYWHSSSGHYRLSIQNDVTNGMYAKAIAQAAQLDDTDCRTFRLFVSGLKTASDAAGTSSTGTCWPD